MQDCIFDAVCCKQVRPLGRGTDGIRDTSVYLSGRLVVHGESISCCEMWEKLLLSKKICLLALFITGLYAGQMRAFNFGTETLFPELRSFSLGFWKWKHRGTELRWWMRRGWMVMADPRTQREVGQVGHYQNPHHCRSSPSVSSNGRNWPREQKLSSHYWGPLGHWTKKPAGQFGCNALHYDFSFYQDQECPELCF